MSADYEKKYSKYKNTNQPRVVAVNVNVAIFPYERKCNIKGNYILKNKSANKIDTLIVSIPGDKEFKKLEIMGGYTTLLNDIEQGFYIYHLNKTLLQGDSIIME